MDISRVLESYERLRQLRRIVFGGSNVLRIVAQKRMSIVQDFFFLKRNVGKLMLF